MIQKLRNNNAPSYEILDYIITPSSSEVNTNVLVNGTTVVEMTCMLRRISYQAPRFFSSNDTNTDAPGWNQAGTWGLQFEDSGTNLSIKMLGADYSRLSDAVIVRTGITYNDLANKKLRYNLTAAGILTIFNTDDTVFGTYDATAETDTSATSSTPIKLFHRYASHEFINNRTYVYDVKIWDNNVLIRHYLPVKRLSDNVYGLYDIINDTFHSNEISENNFFGASKSTPEYIYNKMLNYVNDIIINGDHINRIYLNGELYWGGDASSTPQPSERYVPALYCMNSADTSTYQEDKATFTLPWQPNPSVAHMIDVELEPISVPARYYGWSLMFGGNTSSQRHMGNIFGVYNQIDGNRLFAAAFSQGMEVTMNVNDYLNKVWKINISNQAGSSSQRNCSAKIIIDNTTILDDTITSTQSNFGTYDPYFIFGGQIERSSNLFTDWQYKLYKFDIYDDNVIVYQLRPYYDTVEQEYGMYDLVNNIFYPSMNVTHQFTGELPQS